MGSRAAVALYALVMVAVVVGVDVVFFRHRFWERLMVNVGIVLVFAAFYLRLLKRPWFDRVTRAGMAGPVERRGGGGLAGAGAGATGSPGGPAAAGAPPRPHPALRG